MPVLAKVKNIYSFSPENSLTIQTVVFIQNNIKIVLVFRHRLSRVDFSVETSRQLKHDSGLKETVSKFQTHSYYCNVDVLMVLQCLVVSTPITKGILCRNVKTKTVKIRFWKKGNCPHCQTCSFQNHSNSLQNAKLSTFFLSPLVRRWES